MARQLMETERYKDIIIPCDRGGFSHNPNIDRIPPYAMVDATKNLNLDKGGRRPRGGTSQVTGVSMSSRLMGIKQFKVGGNNFIVRATADGNIFKNDTDTIKTGWATNRKVRFAEMNKLIFACNGYDRPQYWDGAAATTTNLTTLHADWTGTNYPGKMIVHGRGVSRRMWAILCPTTQYSVYYSANDNANNFSSGGGGGVIDIETGDESGVLDLIEFGDRLFVCSKTRFYLIDDDNVDTTTWGYQEAQWFGGAYTDLMVRIPGAVVAMTDKGDIYLVSAAQEYGDYSYASLSNPDPKKVALNENPYITKWITEYIDLSKINDFHAIYSQTHRCIYFFMTPLGYTTIKLALVYYIDRPPAEAWMIHNNYQYSSGYDASCSAEIEVGTGDYYVYTGDYSGLLWRLQTGNINDNGSPYYHGFTTPFIFADNPLDYNSFKEGTVVTQPEGNYFVSANTWVDTSQLPLRTISLSGGGTPLGSFQFDVSKLAGNNLIDDRWKIGSKGQRVKCELFNNSLNEDYFISQVIISYKKSGRQPK